MALTVSDDLLLAIGEVTRFGQDYVGKAQLHDIVHKGAAGNYLNLFFRQPQDFGNRYGESGDSLGAAFRPGGFEAEYVAESFKSNVIRALQLLGTLRDLMLCITQVLL